MAEETETSFSERCKSQNNAENIFSILKNPNKASYSNPGEIIETQSEVSTGYVAIDSSSGSNTLSDTEQETYTQIKNASKIKYISMFYGMYMSSSDSDIQWRLGNIRKNITTLSESLKEDNSVMFDNYTRSDVSYAYEGPRLSYNSKVNARRYYSSLGFPPYKATDESTFKKASAFTNKVTAFNYTNFIAFPESPVLRDVGFKSLNDYISLIQNVTSGITGVVSTELTEWDLSVYMQEQIIAPKVNSDFHLRLSFNIKQDNPSLYDNDDALTYNVCGCAVSYIDKDNEKTWNPEKNLSTPWWTPYNWSISSYTHTWKEKVEGHLFKQKFEYTQNYLSIFDEDTNFSYSSKSTQNVIAHQDKLLAAFSCKHNNTLHYFDAFYTTSATALTGADVIRANFIDKAAGLKAGTESAHSLTQKDLMNLMKCENIADSGIKGECTAADGTPSGEYSRQTIKDFLIADKVMPDSSDSGSYSYYSDAAKKQSTDFSGVNRFSPALFGGPHGKDVSPFCVKSYFDIDSTIMRNVPRVCPTSTIDETSSKATTDNNKYYYNDNNFGQSPAAGIHQLLTGKSIKIKGKGKKIVNKSGWIEASDVSYNSETNAYDLYTFPTANDDNVSYVYDESKGTRWHHKTKTVSYEEYKNMIKHSSGLKDIWSEATATRKIYFKNGETVVDLSVKWPSKYATYGVLKDATVVYPQMWNKPLMEWKIVPHTFKSFKQDNSYSNTVLKSWCDENRNDYSLTFTEDELKDRNINKWGFVLELNDTDQQAIIDELIQRGKNKKEPTVELYFLEGNSTEEERLEKGPDSFFKASVHLVYETSYESTTSSKFLWKTYSYKNVKKPYLIVDLIRSSDFQDGLTKECLNNDYVDGTSNPPHLIDKFNERPGGVQYYHHPLNKMTGDTSSELIIYKKIFHLFSDNEQGIEYDSVSNMSLHGFGIMSSFPGAGNSGWTDQTLSNSLSYNYKTYMEVPNYTLSLPLSSYTYKYHNFLDPVSEKKTYSNGSQKWTKGVVPSQSSVTEGIFDAALKKAWLRACTRGFFIPDTYDVSDGGIWIDSSVPFRNMLSICYENISSISAFEGLFDSMTCISNLKQMIPDYVDNCVLYACGLDPETHERVLPATKSIFYDYWLAELIKMVFGKILLEPSPISASSMRNELAAMKSNIEACIAVLEPLCSKNIEEWSVQDFLDANSACSAFEKLQNSQSDVDKFIMGYLHMLYYYRLYFVGKRFNKTDGTMWMMRGLEQNMSWADSETDEPSGPSSVNDGPNKLPVVFYNLQNTPADKREAALTGKTLELDRHAKVYVKVEYVTEAVYNSNPSAYKVIEHNGVTKYARLYKNGTWSYLSDEYIQDVLNQQWNSDNPEETPKVTYNLPECDLTIDWDNVDIVFDCFDASNIDFLALLEYNSSSISANDLICLSQESADFWKIDIPEAQMPLDSLWKTNLKLVYNYSKSGISYTDPYVTTLGPFANKASPIGSTVSFDTTSITQSLVQSLI